MPIGAVIELLDDPPPDAGLCAGDRGVVENIAPEGNVVIAWERGFTFEIDPRLTRIRRLAA